MYYKCYFHTKTDGAHVCRGCKLPICDDCQHDLGFCPECMRKRDAVDDLRNLRKNVAAKSKLASSTTARLRLAIRQASPIAKRGRLAKGSIDISLMATGSLAGANAWQDAAMATEARVPRHFKDMIEQRKSQWTYDPDRVAYRGVAGPQAAPQTRKAPVERRAAAPRVQRSRPEEISTPNVWAKPFVMGLGVGLVVVLGATFGNGLMKAAPKAKAKPIYSQLNEADRKLVAQVNGTDEASVKARAKAKARRALMNEAFAEADGMARQVAATEHAHAVQAHNAAVRAAARVQHAAPVPAAPAPDAPVAQVAAPTRTVSYARPAAAARVPAYNHLPMPGGSSRGITIRQNASGNSGSWQKSGGMLVTSW